jgi:hypothetical protein
VTSFESLKNAEGRPPNGDPPIQPLRGTTSPIAGYRPPLTGSSVVLAGKAGAMTEFPGQCGHELAFSRAIV